MLVKLNVMLIFIILFNENEAAIIKLCEYCTCTPYNESPTKIVCDNVKNDLKTTKNDSEPLTSLETIEFRNMSSVFLDTGSFENVAELSLVLLENIKKVKIASNVFKNVIKIQISNVQNLELEHETFVDLNTMKNMVIKNTYIPKLPKGFLKNIKLKELTFINSNVGIIESNSLIIESDLFNIFKSNFNEIRSKGITVKIYSALNIRDSTFNFISNEGINIEDNDRLNIKGNTFGRIIPNSFSVKAKNIEIRQNNFKAVYLNEISKFGLNQLVFINNTVDLVCLENWNPIFDNFSFKDNYLNCTCSLYLYLKQFKGGDFLNGNRCVGKFGNVTVSEMLSTAGDVCIDEEKNNNECLEIMVFSKSNMCVLCFRNNLFVLVLIYFIIFSVI